jgi:hypothetical protein
MKEVKCMDDWEKRRIYNTWKTYFGIGAAPGILVWPLALYCWVTGIMNVFSISIFVVAGLCAVSACFHLVLYFNKATWTR